MDQPQALQVLQLRQRRQRLGWSQHDQQRLIAQGLDQRVGAGHRFILTRNRVGPRADSKCVTAALVGAVSMG